jgi:dTDP-4-amino-4,6-dideoxygalactose transaminase
MKVAFYTSTREYAAHKAEFDAAVEAVMARGDFILGGDVAEFEKEAAAWLGAKHAIGVASGSDALIIAADILGFRDSAEVLTPTFTFFASTSCVARLGGKPVFVDMDENTLNMDLKQAASLAGPRTKGIIPVHLFLQPTPMAEVMALAKSKGLSVLEDAAEAWGMESLLGDRWRKAGTIGDIGIYSFFPTKTLGAYGDAGLMVTDDDALAAKIRSYRVHGSSVKYQHDYVGYNSRLDTLQAAILRVKLKNTDASIDARARLAARYSERLSRVPDIRLPAARDDSKPVFYVYNILVQNRDDLAEYLKKKDIGYSVYYPKPLHLQKCFEHLGYKPGDFPIAERVSKEIIALPMYPELLSDEVDFVCDTIEEFFGK